MAENNKTRQRIFLAALVLLALLFAGGNIYNTMLTRAENDAAAPPATTN